MSSKKHPKDPQITIPKYLFEMLVEIIGACNDDSSRWWSLAGNTIEQLKSDHKSGVISEATYKETFTVLDECGLVSHNTEDDAKEEST